MRALITIVPGLGYVKWCSHNLGAAGHNRGREEVGGWR